MVYPTRFPLPIILLDLSRTQILIKESCNFFLKKVNFFPSQQELFVFFKSCTYMERPNAYLLCPFYFSAFAGKRISASNIAPDLPAPIPSPAQKRQNGSAQTPIVLNNQTPVASKQRPVSYHPQFREGGGANSISRRRKTKRSSS